MHDDYQVFLDLDVGKDGHHAVALDRGGKRLHDAALVNTEAKLRQVFGKLAKHGPVLVVVDQPASIGALPVAVARACGLQVAYLPGLAMRRIADLHPGSAKTDARDAYAIADAARTMPSSRCCRVAADQPGCARPAAANCSRSPPRTRRAWVNA
ncbi:hypothetical protein Ato02nite_072020 [Paractinoplanes toevensis]|uniref:Transposase IS110-like N-terminal domain-containing protein n=1 Tax=Paractinoplanes toevensis TaxID=571911 RepID=A0A919TG52_9ACTN|nr:hypothetical protein Ato02nite_072020 [Actinoplanes toevensis]